MNQLNTASKQEWLQARLALLEEEKILTRARDTVTRLRQQLPWVRVEERYEFATETGTTSLSDLFGDHNQLIVQHYMFAPDWNEGCKSCSFWADQFNPVVAHLAARDVSLVVVSQAPYAKLAQFRQRMGWEFTWVSSAPSNFSNDYDVWYTPEQIESGRTFYNFKQGHHYGEHAPGVSVFAKSEEGEIFHTYSCYARGLDMLNGAYHLLDLVPKGRDEQDLPTSMSWLRLHDEYEAK